MTWEEKIRMAKEGDPTLSDEKAAEVVNDLTQLAHLAYAPTSPRNGKLPNKSRAGRPRKRSFPFV